MDIRYNKFKVTFHQKYNSQLKEIKFYENESDLINENLVEIEENRIISIKFQCEDNSAKLYMDGLDTLPLEALPKGAVNLENNEVFVKPSNEEIPIYKNGFYPLIPGIYSIRVVINEVTYYSLFKVINKMLTENEANIIKKELEDEISGIAFEFIRRSFSVADKGIMSEIPVELYKFFIIANEFSNIMNSLMELRVRPNYKINNKYKIISEERIKNIDSITIESYLNNSVKQGFLKVPIRYIEYNLPENRWVKKIILEVFDLLNKFSKEIDRIIINKNKKIENIKKYINSRSSTVELSEELKSLDYINELKLKTIKMRSSINILKSTEWYNLLGENITYHIPHVLIQDSRYNILYRVYKKLHDDGFRIENNYRYSVQWKRTDKLYEMWCYIKICKIIKDKLEYKNVDGWIFDRKSIKKNSIIDDLNPNTIVRFQKNNVRINFYYDALIPQYSSQTDIYNNPIFIKALNNRPDGRLDVYSNDIYLGSIIFEFKYRNREVIWDKNYDKHLKESVVRQLFAYGNNCDSVYMLKKYGEKPGTKIKLPPVRCVMVLYPESRKENLDIDNVDDHNLKFIKIRPKKNIEILTKEIENEINCLLDNEGLREYELKNSSK